MSFFKNVINIRVNDKVIEMVKYLVSKYPDDYPSESQVFRSAITQLYKWKIKKEVVNNDKRSNT